MPNVTDGKLMDRGEFSHRTPRIDLDDAKRLFVRSLVLASDGRVSFPIGRDTIAINYLERGKWVQGDNEVESEGTDYHYSVVREQNPKLWMERMSQVVDYVRACGTDSEYCEVLGDVTAAHNFIISAWTYLTAGSRKQM